MLRTIRLLAVALAAIVFLAACGGAASPPGVATLDDPQASGSPGASPSASTSPQDAMLAYAQCMRDNGVDMPDPQMIEGENGERGFTIGGPNKGQGGGTAPSKDEFEKADAECRHFLASMVQDKGSPQISAEDQDKVLAFTRCMREHGIDMPDPDFSGGGVMIKGGGPGDEGSRPEFDPSSDEFQAAQEACESLLPGGGFKKGGGPSTNTAPDGTVNR